MEAPRNYWRPATRSAAEAILARVAANFPDLVDPDCKRALEIHTKPEELLEFLEIEFLQLSEKKNRGSVRLMDLFVDRARFGTPEKKEG